MSALIGSRAVAIPIPGGIRSESRRPGLVALLGVLAAIWLALSQVGAIPGIPVDLTRSAETAADGSSAKAEGGPAAAKAEAGEAFGQLPVSFIPNRGQLDGEVSYHAVGSRESFYFTPDRAVLAFQGGLGRGGSAARDGMGLALALRFLGANPDVAISGAARQEGVVNYLIGDDPSRWQTGLPTFEEVVYRDLWPGIDMAFRGEAGRLKYEFVVHPGADPADIRLAYGGAQWLTVAPSGDLEIQTQVGNLRDTRPVTYQEIGGRRVAVESRYVVRRGVGYGFTVGGYDPGRPLVIDPGLVYSTFLGGSGRDTGNDIAVDASGSAYMTGETESANFPTTTGAFDSTHNGVQDAWVAKLNPAGTGLLYSTFLGGNSSDSGHGVAVDASGTAYVTGLTASTNFPTTAGAFDSTHNGNQDVFVTKLSPTGGAPLLYSTFLGGSSLDWGGVLGGGGIAVDALGGAYVTGQTLSTNFPTPGGSYDRSHNGSSDAFAAKLDTTRTGPSSLVYSTFLGGGANDTGEGIAVDASGSAHVTGDTASADYPTTAGAFDTTQNGSRDAFVTKLNANGSNLLYSTFLGGSAFDRGFDVAVDASGAYVTGQTLSATYPTTAGSFDTSHNGNDDAFVTKLNPIGTALLYSTFLGGTGGDFGSGVAVDASGSAYVTGSTSSTNFPTTAGAYDTTHNGNSDAFVTKLNPTGTAPLLYSTFLGGGGADTGEGIAVDASGSGYVTGQTSSTDYPTTPVAFDSTHNGNSDAFVTKLDLVANPPVPNSIALSPATDTNPAGTQHCVTATVRDQFNNTMSGVRVVFTVTGANPQPAATRTTNASGEAQFCYTGTAVGTDTIRAFADTNGNGSQDGGEPFGTATKVWVAGTPANVTLRPETDSNPTGSEHCVTATVTDASNNPVPNATVIFSVTGASAQAATSKTTNNLGEAEFCYTGTRVGPDTISAFVDNNGNGSQDAGEPFDTATKTWVPATAATVTVEPATDTNPAGSEHCVTATVTDASGNPVPGVEVFFTVSGAHTTSGSDTTGAQGQASFCYTGTAVGVDTIRATADADGDGVPESTEPFGTATKAWGPGAPATVTVEPASDTNPAGTAHCVTATVEDAFGNPVPDAEVLFTVTGANPQPAATRTTNDSGEAEFCYTGTNAGTDTIRAVADANGNGQEDTGEPTGIATKIYTPAQPATVTVQPAADTNQAGTEHCVDATVRDIFGNGVSEVEVFFTVSGANVAAGRDTTDEFGVARFCYTGTTTGLDTIDAVADADGDGTPEEPEEPSGTASKTWTPARPATVTLEPATDTNRAGEEHCVTATVRDAFGNTVDSGVRVFFTVSGANSRSGTELTDANGQVEFCYTGMNAGTDTIRAVADANDTGTEDAGDTPPAVATKVYGPAAPFSVTVTPAAGVNRAGQEHCVAATVRDQFGNPVPGVEVFFTVSGSNPDGGSDVTDGNGIATFCYTGTNVGEDVIRAVADADDDGVPESTEPAGTATKTYTAAEPATVTVLPPTAINRAGQEHCVTATVRDEFGNPVPDVEVLFEVTGANTRTGADVTDGAGQATFCYTGTAAGADTIRATADSDGDGQAEFGEPFGLATKMYGPADAATVTVEPATDTNRAGEEHCVTATVRDEFGNVVPGVRVFFTVTGANTAGGSQTTDDAGQAVFCYTGRTAGADTITAVADSDGDGQQDAGEPIGTATKVYTPAQPASVVVTPATDTNRAGEEHCVTATVRDAFGNPVPGVRVFFQVTGANSRTGTDTTDDAGEATFCYTGTLVGVDTIRATADADGDNQQDAGEPIGTATKVYTPAQPASVVVTPATDTNRAGEEHCVTATVRDAFGNPVPGVRVFFQVTGANSRTGTDTTDDAGEATFCYTGTTAGTDTIRAVADANESGIEDVGDTPPGLATKIYGPALPASVTVEPLADTNRAGEEHCVTATVRDVFGNRVPGVKVFFSVTGANTASGTDTTDDAGRATFCYTGTRAGLDTIRAVADADGDNTPEATESSGEATKTYTPAEPASVTVEPPTDTNPAGEEHCVTATVRDAFGNPVPGVRVFFTVTGANTASGAETTDDDGQVTFCYTGTRAGEDVIRAVADADGDGQAEAGEPTGTATKTYTPGAPTTVSMVPLADINRAGEEHCVTATVRDEFGNPVPGVKVFFTVTGANTAAGTETTDDDGEATFCYTGTAAGEDVIRAVADANGNNQGDAGEPTGTATKTYTPAAPATVTVEPVSDTNRAGEEHCVTATVRDAFGNPTPGVKVFFSVSGANTATGSDTTDPNGQATFCYTGTTAGVDTIRATADANGNNQPDSGEPTGTATKTYTAAQPATLTLEPKADTNTVGDQHCVTATVRDQFGNPVPGVRVLFSVTGSPNVRDRTSGSATTNQSGQATFCYTALLPGQDAIRAFADTNGNGTEDVGEPSDTATKTWILPPSTPLCQVSISDGGRITAANGDRATFGGNAKVSADGEPSGQQTYQDHGPAQEMTVKSIDILAVTCDSDRRQASIYGTATIDGAGSHYFRIQVKDLSKNGKNDTYWILLDTGYSSGEQRLQLGNITIR
jgi:protocatechuate 3,4-dioxygenase beta subunit